MEESKMSRYAPLILRIGIAAVFFFFAFSQFSNPSQWAGMMPSYVTSIIPLSPTTLIQINASFEIIFGLLLLLGLFTKVASLLLSLHLFHITTVLGLGPTGARDFALALATLSIFFMGPDELTLDAWIKKRKEMRTALGEHASVSTTQTNMTKPKIETKPDMKKEEKKPEERSENNKPEVKTGVQPVAKKENNNTTKN